MRLSKDKKQLALNIIEDAFAETSHNEERACIITSRIEAILNGTSTASLDDTLPRQRMLVSDKETVLNHVRAIFKETTSHDERVCILKNTLNKLNIPTYNKIIVQGVDLKSLVENGDIHLTGEGYEIDHDEFGNEIRVRRL